MKEIKMFTVKKLSKSKHISGSSTKIFVFQIHRHFW